MAVSRMAGAMIFPYQVKWQAEKHLRLVLKEYPGILRYVLRPHVFETWVRLCTERLNQLDLAGYVRSKAAAEQFIKAAACAYADVQLKRYGVADQDKKA